MGSCLFMEHGLSFELNTLYDCCIFHHKNKGMPILIKDYNGEMIDWETIFKIKEERIEKQKIKTIDECEGCYMLSQVPFEHKRYISQIAFNHIKLCNCRCIYCGDDFRLNPDYYDVLPVIKDLFEKGYFNPNGEITFQGGEPTLMRGFEDLLEIFIKSGTKIRIHSSGIKYSHTIKQAIDKGLATIVISLDCGEKALYQKIKRVSCFDKTCENIKLYTQNIPNDFRNNVRVKYIVIPGYNDSVEDVDKFFDKIRELNVFSVAFDMENQYSNANIEVSPHINLLFDYLQYCAKKYNLHYIIYSFAGYVIKERKIKIYKRLLENKDKLSKIVHSYRNKYVFKNISYPDTKSLILNLRGGGV